MEYVWKDGNPVQLANNLSLPGGFKLGAFGSEYCDVVTATGKKIIAKLEKKEIIFFAKQRFGKPSLNYYLTFWKLENSQNLASEPNDYELDCLFAFLCNKVA